MTEEALVPVQINSDERERIHGNDKVRHRNQGNIEEWSQKNLPRAKQLLGNFLVPSSGPGGLAWRGSKDVTTFGAEFN